MDAPRREQVDHKNRNGLDNRRSNLRLCSDMQNKHNMAPYKNNKSGLKGVTFFQGKYWRATIVVNKKQISLGLYKTPGEAARAYDEAALANFGEFARINGTRN
jgi:AP2 domain.